MEAAMTITIGCPACAGPDVTKTMCNECTTFKLCVADTCKVCLNKGLVNAYDSWSHKTYVRLQKPDGTWTVPRWEHRSHVICPENCEASLLRRDKMMKILGKDQYPPCHLASSFAQNAEPLKMVWFQSAHHPEPDISGPRIVRSATSGGAAADPRVPIVYE